MKNFVLISLVFFSAKAFSTPSPQEMLLSSIKAFDKGQYQEALKLMALLDIRNDLDSSDDMKMAFKVRAISYAETGDEAHAQETVRELLFLDPQYKFDLFDTPAKVVEIALKEKKLIEEKNRQLASIKETEETKLPLVPEPLVLEKPAFATNFLPFGLNHFYLNSPIKGGVYLSMQTLGLITNIAAFWWKQSYLIGIGSHHLKEHEPQGSFNTAQMVQFVGLGTLIASFAVSVIDALIQFNRTSSRTIGPNAIVN